MNIKQEYIIVPKEQIMEELKLEDNVKKNFKQLEAILGRTVVRIEWVAEGLKLYFEEPDSKE
jgi:hypothetical protein